MQTAFNVSICRIDELYLCMWIMAVSQYGYGPLREQRPCHTCQYRPRSSNIRKRFQEPMELLIAHRKIRTIFIIIICVFFFFHLHHQYCSIELIHVDIIITTITNSYIVISILKETYQNIRCALLILLLWLKAQKSNQNRTSTTTTRQLKQS